MSTRRLDAEQRLVAPWAGKSIVQAAKVQRAFGIRLTERGFERKPGAKGYSYWHGLGLRVDDVDDVDKVLENSPTRNSYSDFSEYSSTSSTSSTSDDSEVW